MTTVIKPTPLEAWAVVRERFMNLPEPEMLATNFEFDADVLADYELHFAAQIELVSQAANNELESLLSDNSFPEYIVNWRIADVRRYLNMIEGSDFEQLHLTAFLRVNNQDILFAMVEPHSPGAEA